VSQKLSAGVARPGPRGCVKRQRRRSAHASLPPRAGAVCAGSTRTGQPGPDGQRQLTTRWTRSTAWSFRPCCPSDRGVRVRRGSRPGNAPSLDSLPFPHDTRSRCPPAGGDANHAPRYRSFHLRRGLVGRLSLGRIPAFTSTVAILNRGIRSGYGNSITTWDSGRAKMLRMRQLALRRIAHRQRATKGIRLPRPRGGLIWITSATIEP
jgi:hypothetical protein